MPLVLVTGLPGSGKSTLAAALAFQLDLPLIAKDRFKEILFDTLGVRDMAWSRQLGVAAVALQFDAMRTVKDAVVDSALWTGRSELERSLRSACRWSRCTATAASSSPVTGSSTVSRPAIATAASARRG